MAVGKLYVVATPIGNLADITLRAIEVLKSVHCVAAEDTRHTLKLLTHYQIRKPLTSYHSHNVTEKGPVLIGKLQAGEDIALVTDAGTPGVSDPGALLIEQALASHIPVEVVPGPTASVSALVVSGLPTHPFAFLGFPPPKGSSRERFFTGAAHLAMTLILYESANRLERTLSDMLTFWGDRRIAVARELTKIHEEVFRGRVSQAQAHFAEGTRGELTLVVAGADEVELADSNGPDQWREELQRLLSLKGMSTRDAVKLIATGFRVPRQRVYEKALEIVQQSLDG
jgi:16S rRNA (cytidine1402-2'-O)-methyltransferase